MFKVNKLMPIVLVVACIYSNSSVVFAKDDINQATQAPKQETTQVQNSGGTNKAVAKPVAPQVPASQVKQDTSQAQVQSSNTVQAQPSTQPKESPNTPSTEPSVNTSSTDQNNTDSFKVSTNQAEVQPVSSIPESSSNTELPSAVRSDTTTEKEPEKKETVSNDASKVAEDTEESDADLNKDTKKDATGKPATDKEQQAKIDSANNKVVLGVKIIFGVLWSAIIILLVYMIIKRVRLNCAWK